MKIFHFQLSDVWGNPKTLVCSVINGSIEYSFYSGHSSNGIRNALCNLGVELPVQKETRYETKKQFSNRVKNLINNSTYKVVNEVETEIKF